MSSRHRKKDIRNGIITPKQAEDKGRACRKALRNPKDLKFIRAYHFLKNLIREIDPPSHERIRIHLADGEWELDRAYFNQPNEKSPTKFNNTWSQVRFRVYYAGTTIVYAASNYALITIWGDRREHWTKKDFEDWDRGMSWAEKNWKDLAKTLLRSSPVKQKVMDTGESWASLAKPVALPPPIFHDSMSDSGSEIGIGSKSTSPIRMAWKKDFMISPICSWSVSTVCDWAKALGIKTEAVQVLKEEDITGEVLLTLDANDFDRMNKDAGRRVFNMGTRRKVEMERAKILERQETDRKSA